MVVWIVIEPNSNAAVTSANAVVTPGGSPTPANASGAVTYYYPRTPPIRHTPAPNLSRDEPWAGDDLRNAILLRPRELAELMERGRRHDYKPVFTWHPDGTAGLRLPAPLWAVHWLDTYRKEHPL